MRITFSDILICCMKVKTSWRKEKQSEEKGKRNVDLQDPFFFSGGGGKRNGGKGFLNMPSLWQ